MAGITGMQTAGGGVVVPFSSDGAAYNAGIDSMESKTRSLEATLRQTGEAIGRIGTQALKMGALLAAPLVEAGREAMKFQKEFADVNSLITDATQQQLVGLKDGIKKIALDIGEDLSVLTRGVYQALSAGVPQADTIRFVELAAKTAVAGASNTFTAVDALTTAVNAYGSQLDKYGDYTQRAAHISDIMFQTVKDGKIEFTQLAGTLGNVASTAASAGVTFEELGAAYATLTLRGIGPEESTTAINAAILSLIQPSEEAADAMDALGIRWKDFRDGAVTFTDIVRQISEKTGQHATAVVSSMFAERRALKGMVALTAESAKTYNAELDSMINATGKMNSALEVQERTVRFDLNRAIAAWHVQMINMGDIVLPMFAEKLKYVTGLLADFSGYAKDHPEQVERIVTGVATTALGLLAFGGVSLVLGRVIKDIGLVIGAARAAAVTISGLIIAPAVATAATTTVNAMLGMKPAIAAVSTGLLSWGTAGIVGLAVAGLAALFGGALLANGQSVKETMSDLWEILKKIGAWTGGAFRDWLKDAATDVKIIQDLFARLAIDSAKFAKEHPSAAATQKTQVFSPDLGIDIGETLHTSAEAFRQETTSLGSLISAVDKYVERMQLAGTISVEQADAIRKLGTEEEKLAAFQKVLGSSSADKAAQLRSSIANEVGLITGQLATEQQIATARQAIEDKSVSARTAAMYAANQITAQELNNIAKVSSTEQKSYDERLRIFYQFHAQEALINSKDTAQQKALLDFLNVKTTSEVQQQEIVNAARSNSLDLATAAFVVQNNLTADQIAMVKQGAMAEVQAMLTKKEARKADVEDQKTSTLETVKNWHTYLDLLDKAYTEMAAKEKELRAKAKEQISTQGFVDPQTAEALIETKRAMRGLAEESRTIASEVGPNIAKALAEVAGISKTVANAMASDEEVLKRHNEKAAAAGALIAKDVIATSQSFQVLYGRLTDEQATALNIGLQNLWETYGRTDIITKAFPELLRRTVELHPEVAKTHAQELVATVQEAAGGIAAVTQPVQQIYAENLAPPSALIGATTDVAGGMFQSWMMYADKLKTNLDPAFADQYTKLTDDQKRFLDITIQQLLNSGESMSSVTARFPTILQGITSLDTETLKTDLASVEEQLQATATNVDGITAPIHDQYNQRFALSHRESPSVLDIMQNDISVMAGIYETLTNVVASATSRIYGLWEDLSNSLVGGIFQDIYAGMQYLNPWATHSPSLVSSVQTGVSAIEQSWLDSADRLYENYKATYANQIALLGEYLAAGNTLNTMIATNARGQIDYRESRIDQGPAGFSVTEYIGMLEELQKISNLLKQAIGINKIFPMVPLTAAQQAVSAAQASVSGSANIGGTQLSYSIEPIDPEQYQQDETDATGLRTLADVLHGKRASTSVSSGYRDGQLNSKRRRSDAQAITADNNPDVISILDPKRWNDYWTKRQHKRDSEVLSLLETGNLYDTTPESMALTALQPSRRRLSRLDDTKPRVEPKRVTRTFAGTGSGMAIDPSLMITAPKWWEVTKAPPTGAAIDAVGGQLLSRVLLDSMPPKQRDRHGPLDSVLPPVSNTTMNMNIGQVRSDTQIRSLAQAAAADAEVLAWRRRR